MKRFGKGIFCIINITSYTASNQVPQCVRRGWSQNRQKLLRTWLGTCHFHEVLPGLAGV
jgi:hypothetical protein